jgi:PAS domain S-box-containing protein
MRSVGDTYRLLFESSLDAMLLIEDEAFIDCNQATMDMLGYDSKEEVLSGHPSSLSPVVQSDGRSSFEKANEMIAIAFRENGHRFEWLHKRKTMRCFPLRSR